MSPEMGKAAFKWACWIVAVAAVLLPFQERGTAEFVLTAASLGLGIAFALAVWLFVRFTSH